MPAQARKRPSPAPMRTPSRTNTQPAIGIVTRGDDEGGDGGCRTSSADVKSGT